MITPYRYNILLTYMQNHEIDHALQFDKKTKQQNKDANIKEKFYDHKEEQRVITGSEQVTAKKLGEIKQGEVTRTNHSGTLYRTTSATSIEEKNPVVVTPKKD